MATPDDENINKFIECVFGFTLKSSGMGLLSVKEFVLDGTELISVEVLEQILFERLLIPDDTIDTHLIGPAPRDHHILETECITYLSECFHRLKNNSVKSLVDESSYQKVKGLITRNISTALKQPGLYEGQNLSDQIIKLTSDTYETDVLVSFFSHIVNDFLATEEASEVDDLLLNAFSPLLSQVTKDLTACTLALVPVTHMNLLVALASVERLAGVLVRFSAVKPPGGTEGAPAVVQGCMYEKTLFGSMLNISCLPKHHQIPNPMSVLKDYFSNALELNSTSLQAIEGNIWFSLERLLDQTTKIFHLILKTKNLSIRNEFLTWIGNCLRNNQKRGKLWTSVNVDIFAQLENMSDAMALNLTGVLLRLSEPIIRAEEKYLRVEPTYCAHNHETAGSDMGIHLPGLHTETCLLPHDASNPRPVPTTPLTFITECYWMTQRSLDLSVRVMLEKLNRTHQDLARLQSSYVDAMAQRGPLATSPVLDHLKEALTVQTSTYMAYRIALLLPSNLSLLSQFQVCTCVYLVQLLVNDKKNEEGKGPVTSPVGNEGSPRVTSSAHNEGNTSVTSPVGNEGSPPVTSPGGNEGSPPVTSSANNEGSTTPVTPSKDEKVVTSYAPLVSRPVNFPLSEEVNPVLRCIPEFVIENLWSFLYLVRHHRVYHLEEAGPKLLNPTLTTILAYMGTNRRVRNPHLRAKLAESLECLLPQQGSAEEDQNHMNPNLLGNTHREGLFHSHPHGSHLVRAVLDIFVGIEMTGESVEFEQKFNYRRPMYAIMRFLWGLDEHRAHFRRLAVQAETNIHCDRPPLFLRFVNLLMNDAVFLLDEALSNMAQIRTMQTARENGEWAALPPREQEQNHGFLQHTGMMARFDNILGNETIHTLEYLTSEIRSIFCHSTLVDRVAAMLNYFLFHLVGPKKKNFKVKDMQEFKFAPATIVLNICKMYVHLGSSDEFCAAVSRDGRSYSPQLFQLAEGVLARIGGADLIPDLRRVASQVATLGALLQSDEALLAGAPEEFLDPIMNTLMTEPVILPSSRQTLDKSTIARHLLSDQSDPFNRSPLTMEQVIPNTELQNEIQAWIRQCRLKSKEPTTVPGTSGAAEKTESDKNAAADSIPESEKPAHSAGDGSVKSNAESSSIPDSSDANSTLPNADSTGTNLSENTGSTTKSDKADARTRGADTGLPTPEGSQRNADSNSS